MSKNYLLLVSIIALIIWFSLKTTETAYGSNDFGVTPAAIHNSYLKPGLTFQTNLLLTRTRTSTAENIDFSLNMPSGANNWFNVNNGQPIIFPTGQTNLTMPVSISVPQSAKIGGYNGHLILNSQTAKQTNNKNTSVDAIIGYKIPINLTVSEQSVKKIEIKTAVFSWATASRKYYFINLPAMTLWQITATNNGNAGKTIKNFHVKIYDVTGKNLITETATARKIKVTPFTEKKMNVSLPIKNLPSGSYLGFIDIVDEDNNQKIYSQQLLFEVKTADFSSFSYWREWLNYFLSLFSF